MLGSRPRDAGAAPLPPWPSGPRVAPPAHAAEPWLASLLARGAARLGEAVQARCGLQAYSRGRAPGLSAGRYTLGRRVVLTFDDGPLWPRTEGLLDVLRARRVPATFFVVGKMVSARSYATLQRIVREGHLLANHGFHHLVDMLRDPRAERLAFAELALTQAVVDLALLARSGPDFAALRRRLLGKEAGLIFVDRLVEWWPGIQARWRAILAERRPGATGSPYPMTFVRPPGGSPYGGRFTEDHKRLYARVLAQLGLVNVLWDEETLESDPRLPAATRRDPARQAASFVAGARKGGILLAHDRMAPAALARALDALAAPPAVRFVPLGWLAGRRFRCAPAEVSLALRLLHDLTPRRLGGARP